jgi:hypothetical protein
MKVSPEGDRLWSVSVFEDDYGHDGNLTSLKIHPVTGNIMALGYVFGTYIYSVLYTLDQDTGRLLNVTEFKDSDGDVELNTIAWTSTGAYVVGGRKKGEFSAEFPVVPQTGSGVGTIVILRSAVPEVSEINDNWQIGGTGISPFQTVAFSERYTGLTGTVREGFGATFDITNNGDGTYTVTAYDRGADYLPGHKIKILGTSLSGGATPDNDIIITVVTNHPINGMTVTHTGTAPGTTVLTDTEVSGTNFEVGSGLTFTIQGPFDDNDYSEHDGSRTITVNGSNYVNSDVVVVPGTSLGGTSPANDLTLDLFIDQNDFYINSMSGTSQSTTWKIETTAQVDFAGAGSWSVTYSRDNDCVLITPTWQRTFGTAKDKFDEIITLTVDSEDNIIAVGDGYGELAANSFDDLSVVYKFNSTGTLQWARQLNGGNNDHEGHSVVTIGTDIYVVDENDEGDSFVSKLDSTGTVKWQRRIEGQDITIARTLDGNLLVAAEEGSAPITTDEDTAIKIFLLTPAGETVWKRWMSPNINYSAYIGSSGESLVTDANSFYITGRNSTDDDNWAWAARLPLDGTGTGEYGQFCYTDVNTETNYWGVDFNYAIDVVDIDDVNNYAGLLGDSSDPLIKTTATVTVTTDGTSDYDVDSYYPPMVVEIVRDTDGGNIVFADGTKQNTSATDIPQRLFNGVAYTLGMGDRGHHILCTDDIESIRIPYNARVEFPIGTVITIVNPRGDDVRIYTEGGSISVMIPGDDNYSNGGSFDLFAYGMATLLKIGMDQWVLAGNVNYD